MAPTLKQKTGNNAEKMAIQYLCRQGLRLIDTNYRSRLGEIDIIMQEQDTIVFIEVRSRNRTDYGTALESINQSKINKIIRAATHYLQGKNLLFKVNSRFDIITFQLHAQKWQLEWIKNAFPA